MSVLPRALLIGVGSLLLTTLSIKAVDQLELQGPNLTGSLSSQGGDCPFGMSLVSLGDRTICVDTYEASPNEHCPHAVLQSSRATEENLANGDCAPESVEGVRPWNNVSLTQAQQLCARSGKRLPSADEWYSYSLGVTDESTCVLDVNDVANTGASSCVSGSGVHDPIGNVWEWIAAEVIDGVLEGKTLPPSGYVSTVDLIGLPLETAEDPNETFGKDYATTQQSGTFGVVRGGFYGSGSDGGLFTLNAAVQHSLATPGIGFRCVQDVRG